ncbi:MAG: hypothetical protein MR355_01480 [Lachnospiraceae bacterium]|nr:hypothetical protein [Lachnospiraceae bacterium]
MSIEEIITISEAMYQNREQETFEWMRKNLGQLKDELLRIASDTEQFPEIPTKEIQQLVVVILQRLISAYQRQQMLELADCMRYEVMQIIELDREMKNGNL